MTNLAVGQICNSRESTICSVHIQEKWILDPVSASAPTNGKTAHG